jgi:predicted dehydrogenase
MVKKYKAAIIGIGRIGYLLQKDKKREQPASHSYALSKNRRINLIAACDINKDRLKCWHKDYPKTNIYTDYRTLLKNESPDLIVIATNEESHLAIALDAIKSKPGLIILEKPVAPNIKDASLILKQSKKYKVPLMINHERRFSKDYRIVKKILDDKLIGDIHAVYASLWTNNAVWTKESYKTGASSLIHDGTHLIDIIYFLFNVKLTMPVIDNIVKDKKNRIISLNLHYILKNKTIVYLDFSGCKDYFGFEIEIRASLGRIIIGNGYFKVYISKPSHLYSNFKSLEKEKKFTKPHKTGYFSNMVQSAVDYLDGKSPLSSSINDGVKVLKSIYDIIDEIK